MGAGLDKLSCLKVLQSLGDSAIRLMLRKKIWRGKKLLKYQKNVTRTIQFFSIPKNMQERKNKSCDDKIRYGREGRGLLAKNKTLLFIFN